MMLTTLLLSIEFSVFLCSAQQQSIYGLRVQGTQIYNGQGEMIRLRGASRSGSEFACVQGWGIFDGPTDNTSIQAITTWNINIIRLPLNEDCWLGINGINSSYAGINYQNAIVGFVNNLNAYNIAVILDLHWSAPGTTLANQQAPMPDKDHSIDFWISVANVFSNNSAVIFDLFNEPYPDNNADSDAAWECWQYGGTCSGVNYEAASLQDLITAVRSTGATNIVLTSGIQYANCFTQYLNRIPYDPLGQMGASWHSYSFNLCSNEACWNNTIAPVAAVLPMFVTEFGEIDCATDYVNPLMDWMDSFQLNYLGWTWNTWGCDDPVLITGYYNATPNDYGIGLYDRLTGSN